MYINQGIRAFLAIIILKSRLAAKLTIFHDYRADFWEFCLDKIRLFSELHILKSQILIQSI